MRKLSCWGGASQIPAKSGSDQNDETFHDGNELCQADTSPSPVSPPSSPQSNANQTSSNDSDQVEAAEDSHRDTMPEIMLEGRAVKDVQIKGLVDYVERLVDEAIASAQRLTTAPIDMDGWASRFAEDTIEQAKLSVMASRVSKVSAIAVRRGQHVKPITLTRQMPRKMDKLYLRIPPVRRPGPGPSYIDSIVASIMKDAMTLACYSARMEHAQKRKSIRRQKRLEFEPEDSPKLFDKLASVLMYQILFDAQNEILKIKMGKQRLKGAIGDAPAPLVDKHGRDKDDVSFTNDVRTVVRHSNGYQIAFDYEEWTQDAEDTCSLTRPNEPNQVDLKVSSFRYSNSATCALLFG